MVIVGTKYTIAVNGEVTLEKQSIQTFDEAVRYLYDMPRFTKKNTPENTKAHLNLLGSLDKQIPFIIHVAGTNGKGTVCAYLRYILEETGAKVATFTSPHLVDIRERFCINGQMMSREDFLRIFLQVYESLDWEALAQDEGYHPTFFEYLFFMGMLWFAEEKPDYCILETGLGGRLDATNCVSHKELTIITRIGLDHVEYLGDTLEAIAAEKAGIMCQGVPLICCGEVEEALTIFEKHGKNLQIQVISVSNKDYALLKFNNKTIDFSLQTRYYGYIGITLHTLARYQMENASIAVRAAEQICGPDGLSAEQIQEGLKKAFWPGRMEEVLPEVFVDGAHNGDGIRAFLETVSGDGCEILGRKRILLFSVVQDKDYEFMINQVLDAALFERIYVAHMETSRATGLEQLKVLWCARDNHPQIYFDENVQGALRRALSDRTDERIYIAGSLYLVGEIKEFLSNDQF